MKLKAVLDQSQMQTENQKGLKQLHHQLKTVIKWLTSIFSSINSTENVTKAVMRFPKNPRTSYNKRFNDTNFNENNINLISFERWLANKIHSWLNPIATLTESTIRSKCSGSQVYKSNKLRHDNKNHRLNSSSQSQSERPHVDDKKLRCWFCRDSHEILDCTISKATPVHDRRELVKKINHVSNVFHQII